MKHFTILLPFLVSFSILAQKPPIKFGDVPEDDLTMTVYPLDSSAAAVVLADYGESEITYNQTNGWEIQFERIRRIKILKKEGYDWANFTIPLFTKDNRDEKLNGLKAVTTNLEGNKPVTSKLDKDAIFKESINENWDHVKLTMPNVKEGSVIDISYHIVSPYLSYYQDWEFQSTIPVRWSEYKARFPEYFEYQRFMQGYVQLKISDNGSNRKVITLRSKERTGGSGFSTGMAKTNFTTHNIEHTEYNYRWVATDVPAFKEEPYMTTYRDYISKINFELAFIKMPDSPIENFLGSWDNVNKELLDANGFGGVVKRSNFLNKTVEELVVGKDSPVEKAIAIYGYVKSNVEWNGNYRLFTDGNFKSVLDEKKGTAADINLMLVSMLQKAGLKADPVAISTRNHGFIRQQFPASSQFNYIICALQMEDKMLLLDATDRSLPMTMLPERCLNGSGLLVAEGKAKWIELSSPVKTRTIVDASLGFEGDGSLKGQVKVLKDGYDGQRMRLAYHTNGEEAYIKSFSEKSGWDIIDSKFENLKDLNEPVNEVHEISLQDGNNLNASILYINPFLNNAVKENPFKSENRIYPVDFGSPFEKTSLIKLKVPEGYIVEELPKTIAIGLPNNGGKYLYSINNMNGIISLTSLMSINKGIFVQEEYPNLREFYNQIVAKQSELIVLKKK